MATTARRSPHMMHAQRPSISPLSSKASPIANRDAPMRDTEAEDDALPDGTVDLAADVGDDRSSSLSDPEDDLEEDGEVFGSSSANIAAEELTAHQSMEIDSEAETERLENTPDKLRKQAENVGRTPSKLVHAATADDEALDDLSEPPSPILLAQGGPSSTSTIDAAAKKRKRSQSEESSLSSPESDLGESPRKRSHSAVANDTTANGETQPEDAPADADEPIDEEAEAAAIPEPVKPGRKKGGRPPKKGRPKLEPAKETEVVQSDAVVQPEEEQNEEAAARSKEESERKLPASTAFEDLAKQFAAFRDKVHGERLAAMDAELDLLKQPDCKHPEYLRQIACIDARYSKQATETRALRKFKLESLRRTTLAERSQLHSQYFQHARELRENVMVKLGEDWYNIQKERRQANQSDDEAYMFKFPTKKSVQIRQQAKYNQEVSVLSGIAKYVGFPAAPDIAGAEGDALDSDLKSMKINKRAAQPAAQPVYFPNRTGFVQAQSERIAHEQFVEQNAWARSQGPILNHGPPGLTHTPDWASEPGAHTAKQLMRSLNGTATNAHSPYATPNPQRRLPEHSSAGTIPANSDPVDAPSSVVAAPPTTDRVHYPHMYVPRDLATMPSPIPVTKQRQNGAERELTGFRNISNISGASTIDAPPDSAEKERGTMKRSAMPGMSKDPSGPHYQFGHGSMKVNDTYPASAFRPQTGQFGSHTQLPTGQQ
ncbi:unnamed protein product [Zymoseptoria tritici ST99CH_1A5]|uniref:Transcriptional regulatory protein DEP1 n=2 Tax=Zymoseptoria tritici TaxID=1047171 RepID=A0A1X7RGU9_ZYMT9|nr:unnamed protein product [Zymoseptoria tritici ST99CH_3D7]SMR45155.1 unnamed protein product [Zymoseptoria tritici ST99CH_3D1]SMY20318.1 unnamed protein product [Zymoseptoria tritici ST99CH_1A5]